MMDQSKWVSDTYTDVKNTGKITPAQIAPVQFTIQITPVPTTPGK